MSFDLIAWKWSPKGQGTATLKEVYETLLSEKPHPAVATLDDKGVSDTIKKEFGDVNGEEGSPFMFFPGYQCLIFSVHRDSGDAAVSKLKSLLRDLHLFYYMPPQAS